MRKGSCRRGQQGMGTLSFLSDGLGLFPLLLLAQKRELSPSQCPPQPGAAAGTRCKSQWDNKTPGKEQPSIPHKHLWGSPSPPHSPSDQTNDSSQAFSIDIFFFLANVYLYQNTKHF